MGNYESCKRCGRIFEDNYRLGVCDECVEKFGKDKEFRAKLSITRNYVKDMELKGELLSVGAVAEGTDICEEEIWMFIRLGEISTASFDDPKVREYKLRESRQRDKVFSGDKDRIAEEIKRVTGGFHFKREKE
ncbi:hypothetical protein J7K50_06580 [bacterium]|nr:hypothetical protein [bacterium]